MGWLYEAFSLPSKKNTAIKCTRRFGSWEVVGGGFFQSSDYVTKMWKRAISRVPREGIRRILVLGLGGGGCIAPLCKRFPRAKITAIEWDPIMVEAAYRMGMYGKKPDILVGDARRLVPELSGMFDLILGDIFQGSEPFQTLRDAEFFASVTAKLEREGYFILNGFRNPEIFGVARQVMGEHRNWRFRYNRLALFRHFGRGCVGDPLPHGYVPYRGVEAYLKRECPDSGHGQTRVGSGDCTGSTWHHGPLWFEGYTSDVEPQPDPRGPKRVVIWQPVSRLDKPTGWRRSWVQMNPNLTGFVDLRQAEPYWSAWTSHAQRHRKRWLADRRFEIREVTAEAYMHIYRSRAVRLRMKSFHVWLLEKKIKKHAGLMVFLGAFDQTGKMVAGFAALDIPEADQSYHVASFILPEVKKTSVGTGLVDAWFRRCLDKGYRFADFDLFWSFGDPWSWRGFSRFKSQFGVTFIRYPKPLFRFVGGGKP
jgi:hypothetical protein